MADANPYDAVFDEIMRAGPPVKIVGELDTDPDVEQPQLSREGQAAAQQGKQYHELLASPGRYFLNPRAAIRASQETQRQLPQRVGGGDLATRLGASFKQSSKGQLEYLQAQYGNANVQPRLTDDGSVEGFLIRKGEDQPWEDFDPAPGDMFWGDLAGDVADVGADVIEGAISIPTTVAGAAAGGPGGAVAGGIAGDVLGTTARKAIGSALPGEESEDVSYGRDLAVNVGTGIVGEGVGKAVKELAPTGWASRLMRNEKVDLPDDVADAIGAPRRGSQVAIERQKLAAETGVDLTPAQLTGGREALTFESVLRQHPGSKDIIHEGDKRRIAQVGKFLDKTIEATAGERIGAEDAGARVAAAYEGYLTKLDDLRSTKAAEEFGRVQELSGGLPVFRLSNTFRALEEIEKAAQGKLTGDSSDPLIRYIQKQKKALLDAKGGPGRATAQEFQNDLRRIGMAARGKGSLVADLDARDSAQERYVATKLFKAMLADLDDAATDPSQLRQLGGQFASGNTAPVGQALKQARDSYKAMSDQIEGSRDILLEKALGLKEQFRADTFAKSLLSNGSQQQVRRSMALLSKADPVAARQLRGAALTELIGRAAPSAASPMGMADAEVSPALLANLAKKNAPIIKELFAGDPKGLADWNKITHVAAILGDAVNESRGSPTAPLGWFKGALGATSRLMNDRRGAVMEFAGILRAKNFARMMNNPQARDEFLRLSDPKRKLGPGDLAKAAAKITAAIARDSILYEDVDIKEREQDQENIRRGLEEFTGAQQRAEDVTQMRQGGSLR